METKKNIIEFRTYKKSHSDKITCSKCGRLLVSSHEGIVGDNNIAFCEYCYENLLFPHFREHYMEITD
jgi:formylmethanofuran dehydrogenase subunit E